MKRILFYCQHILGMGHFVRSMEIVRGLVKDFQVCFINGGEIIPGFPIPSEVKIINFPAIKSDREFQQLQVVDGNYTLAEVQKIRRNKLLEIYYRWQPHILIIELFPFGRRGFSFELIPLLKKIRADGNKTKVVSSLRDIVVSKQDKVGYEEKVCQLMNQYFDMLLIHSDPKFQTLEETFSRVTDLNCQIHYTGYVIQSQCEEEEKSIDIEQPIILVSIGAGRFGDCLLDCVVETASLLKGKLPHQFTIFTGPFIPNAKFLDLQNKAIKSDNIKLEKYTPNLLKYMKQAELSISMAGYNTTMNILTTGVRSMMMAFTGNGDREQIIRAKKLEQLGIVRVIEPQELQPQIFAENIINYLQEKNNHLALNFHGVNKTNSLLKTLITDQSNSNYRAN